jgi:hypothetical protein
LPQALQGEAIEGPFSEAQWSSGAPSSSTGGAMATEHTPFVGTHTRTDAPAVEVTSWHESPDAQGLDVEHAVPQYRSPANWPHVPLMHSAPEAHGAH